MAKEAGRGWRRDKANRSARIDATVALAMAVDRAEHVAEPLQLLGWL